MSREFPNSNDEQLNWLNRSFDEWDAGEPSAGVWENLDESLAVDAVWSRIDQSLLAEDHVEDSWISASHEEWNPGPSSDGWSKLNEAISLETVWTDLNETLSHPVATRVPFWKMLAASVVALFMTQQFSDAPVVHQGQPAPSVAQNEIATSPTEPASGTIAAPATDPTAPEIAVVTEPSNTPMRNNRIIEIPQNDPLAERRDPVTDPMRTPENGTVNAQNIVPQPSVSGVGNVLNPLELLIAQSGIAPVNTLSPLAYDNALNPYHDPVFPRDFLVKPPLHHWTVQMGTQLSILQEREQSLLTSTAPRFGLAADLSYTHRLGPIQLIHSIGVSQYAQESGKYLNGRHIRTDQRVNALQLSSCAGYNIDRFTVYGGVLFSKILSGLEQEDINNKIIGVYSFSEIQPGLTGGMDFRIVSFPRSGKHVSVGAQYQWMPSLQSKKNSFENMQGIRFQAKFSF